MQLIAGSVLLMLARVVSSNEGYFWHVTDMHWDPTYATDEAGLSCNPGSPSDGPYGMFGDFRCDPPWRLIQSGFDAMKNIKQDVDFIIWTGDDTPHIWDNDILHKDWVLEIINNQTRIIMDTFPDAPVFSAIGNHDWSPKNQLPPAPDPFYERIQEAWAPWFSGENNETFSKGAYYTSLINPQLRIIVLNTNLYYDSNDLTWKMHDPANQMQWFDDVMIEANYSNQKVIVIGHVPPGMFEKHPNKHWYYPFYNDALLNMLSKHAHTIGSMHFAHHHTDSFRLVRNDDGEVVTSILLAPALSPWETTLPEVMGGTGNNPSFRLLKYNTVTGEILDIHQYWLNLTAANEAGEANWMTEYNATQYYNIDDVSTQALAGLADQMKTDDAIFDRYYRANGVIYDPNETWDEETRLVHQCAITELNYEAYADCVGVGVSGSTILTSPHHFCMLFLTSVLMFYTRAST